MLGHLQKKGSSSGLWISEAKYASADPTDLVAITLLECYSSRDSPYQDSDSDRGALFRHGDALLRHLDALFRHFSHQHIALRNLSQAASPHAAARLVVHEDHGTLASHRM